MPRLIDMLKDTGWGNDLWFAPVIMAESGGNPKAKNNRTPCGRRKDGSPAYAVGLTQICTIHLDPGGIAAGLTEEDLQNPYVSLKVARKIFDAQGKGAWEAITNGSANAYPQATSLNKDIPYDEGLKLSDIGGALLTGIPGVKALVGGIDAVGGGVPSPGDVADAVTDIPDAIGAAVETLTKQETWFTVAKVVFGGALILIGTAGLVFVVAKNVQSATPIGAIRKAIT